MPTSGTDLKVRRVRANVKLMDLAEAMGLSRQALWSLERAGQVSPERVALYVSALETFRDVKGDRVA